MKGCKHQKTGVKLMLNPQTHSQHLTHNRKITLLKRFPFKERALEEHHITIWKYKKKNHV